MEPIVVDRKTGKIISAPVLTPEERDKMWEQYIRCYVRRNPKIFEAPAQANADANLIIKKD